MTALETNPNISYHCPQCDTMLIPMGNQAEIFLFHPDAMPIYFHDTKPPAPINCPHAGKKFKFPRKEIQLEEISNDSIPPINA